MGFLLFAIFFVMLFPRELQRILYQLSISGILISAFFCIDKMSQRYMRWVFILTIFLVWTHYLSGNILLNVISKSATICLYVSIVFWLVKQAASSKTVTRIVILESVNGYLMIGMFYSVIIGLIMILNPQAYYFKTPIHDNENIFTNFNEYLYYGFNAFTTVTYGDVLPVSPVAKSLSMAIGFTGQMYVAVIIAMLVGKYAGRNRKDD
jgi:hypothetical protein